QGGVDGGLAAGLLFLLVLDVVVGVATDLLQVAALDQIAQGGDEILPLFRLQAIPVLGERTVGQLSVVEEAAQKLAYRRLLAVRFRGPVRVFLLQQLVELLVRLLQFGERARSGGRRNSGDVLVFGWGGGGGRSARDTAGAGGLARLGCRL